MRPGIDTDPEIKAQALALYAETQSSVQAAQRMADDYGVELDHSTLRRWAHSVDGFTQRLRSEQKQHLADTWYEVASQGAERMTGIIKELPGNQLAVPAAIATDKYLKLTEETPQGNTANVMVFVGVKVEK